MSCLSAGEGGSVRQNTLRQARGKSACGRAAPDAMGSCVAQQCPHVALSELDIDLVLRCEAAANNSLILAKLIKSTKDEVGVYDE